MPGIMHLLKIHAPAARIYQALTTSEDIRNWWTRDADLENVWGGIGDFRFDYTGKTVVTKVRVTQLVPSVRVSWTVSDSYRPEWVETSITFDLREEAGGTVIHFTHCGFPLANEAYALCTTGWGYYLISLQQYLETGQGLPSPDVNFGRVLKTSLATLVS